MIEILIGMLILAFGFLPIYNLFRQGSVTTVSNVQETLATNYASDLINFCKDIKYYQILSIDDKADSFTFKNDAEISEFFSQIDMISPPAVPKPYGRSLNIKRYKFPSLVESITDFFKKRKFVPSYMVCVKVTFPKMADSKAEDDVTLYSIVMD